MKKNNLSLVFMKNGKTIFESNKNGLSSFIEAINLHNQDLRNTSVADKVVGKAAALLGVYAEIKTVYASTLSTEGYRILKKYNIPVKYNKMTEKILNNQGTDLCPFEKSVLNIDEPKEALITTKKTIQILSTRQ